VEREEELGMIHSRQDGHLECDMHAGQGYLTWCDHIAEVVAKGRDAEQIHPVTGTTIIQCPMLPAAVNLFQEVVLEPLIARVQGVCVIEMEHSGMAFSVGHLMPGEGRGVIRENIVQWMVTQQVPEAIQCKSSSHNFSDMARIDQMKQDRPTAWLMECWCMFSTNMCTHCYRKFLDIADVIPTGS
jgi:hypothetical protein